MKKMTLLFIYLLLMFISAGCSNDENIGESDIVVFDPNSIVGTWELKTLCYPGSDLELPLEYRDVFIFDSNGKLMVTKSRPSFFKPEFGITTLYTVCSNKGHVVQADMMPA